MSTLTLERNFSDEDAQEPDTGLRKHLWTVTEVYRAMELGLFGAPTDRLNMELIEGELIEKMPQGRSHGIAVLEIPPLLMQAFGAGHHVSTQLPLNINQITNPEPDLMVVVGKPRDYKTHPTADKVKLVVEVSDTTLRQDRITKVRLYAQAGITEYWVLMLKSRRLEVRRDPILLDSRTGEFGYQSLTVHTESDVVSPLHAPKATIAVADLLPPASEE